MNSDMKMYFCEIGGAPHRFLAANKPTAERLAEQRAQLVGASFWSKPELYNVVVHEQHFDREFRL